MQKSSFELEKKLYKRDYDWVVGIDEAGRGPLAGPVVAVAAAWRNFEFKIWDLEASSNNKILNISRNDNKNRKKSAFKNSKLINSEVNQNYKFQILNSNLIRDSKTLSEKQREEIYEFIMKNFFTGVGICDHRTIDRMNILQASFLAMKLALTSLKSKIKNQNAKLQIKMQKYASSPPGADLSLPSYATGHSKKGEKEVKFIILIDGNKKIPNFSGEQIVVPQGDKKVKSISAASIVAKVTRDRIMREAHKKYPRYGFDQHKGYGTKMHMEALRKYGYCKIHRQSFAPVKKAIQSASL